MIKWLRSNGKATNPIVLFIYSLIAASIEAFIIFDFLMGAALGGGETSESDPLRFLYNPLTYILFTFSLLTMMILIEYHNTRKNIGRTILIITIPFFIPIFLLFLLLFLPWIIRF